MADQAAKIIEQANALYKEKQYQNAADTYGKALACEGISEFDHVRALQNRSLCYFNIVS